MKVSASFSPVVITLEDRADVETFFALLLAADSEVRGSSQRVYRMHQDLRVLFSSYVSFGGESK